MACCTHLIGPKAFFTRLFDKMGVSLKKGTAHYLELQSTALLRRQAKHKLPATKKSRNEANFDKLRKQLERLSKDRAKHTVYQPGIGMTCTDIVEARCPSCNILGHSRRSSRHCLANPANDDVVSLSVQSSIQQSVLDGVELSDGMAEEMRIILDEIEEDSTL